MSTETQPPATTELVEYELPTTSGSLMLSGGAGFAHIQRVAKMFAASDLVPDAFKGKPANCTIALEMAHRMGANPMAVMQNLYIVHGRPGWSSQFIIACINQCGKFSPLRSKITGEGDNKTCVAWAIEKDTNERLEGPPVSIRMAKDEGWYGKNGSKWKTMDDLMLRYRAATFFGRMYAPDLLMGMATTEELHDVPPTARNVTPARVPNILPPPAASPAPDAPDSQRPPSGEMNLGDKQLSLVEVIEQKVERTGLPWAEIRELAADNGLKTLGRTIKDSAESDLKELLDGWDMLTAEGGGQ